VRDLATETPKLKCLLTNKKRGRGEYETAGRTIFWGGEAEDQVAKRVKTGNRNCGILEQGVEKRGGTRELEVRLKAPRPWQQLDRQRTTSREEV